MALRSPRKLESEKLKLGWSVLEFNTPLYMLKIKGVNRFINKIAEYVSLERMKVLSTRFCFGIKISKLILKSLSFKSADT